jgi:1-acyl-sn-glycerol-3-phosphate acyltransferase
MRRLRRVIVWYGTVVIRILPYPLVRVQYKYYARNEGEGPFIFVSNHRSFSDGFLMAYPCFSVEGIQVVNKWPFRIPILGFVAKIAGYLSVREMPFEDFKAVTTKLLREGVSIVVFPEGTRSRDMAVGQFHGAIFRVALETRKPIIPVCISGNEKIPPVGSALLHPGIIKVHRLKALLWEEYGALSPFKLKNYVRRIIIDEVADMERCS